MANARHFAETSAIAARLFLTISYYDAAKVVGGNTHLTQIQHNHYDPRK